MKHIIPVRGMHCRSCELTLERALRDIEGVTMVKANVRKATVTIDTKGSVDLEVINDAIRSAGYDVGQNEKKPFFSQNSEDYGLLFVAIIIVLVLASVARMIDLTSIQGSNNISGLTSSLLLGLTAGVSTCMALVGGLVLGVATKHAKKHPEATALQKFRPHAFFNVGRIIGFAFFGGLLGLVGSLIAPSSIFLGILMIIVALFMLIMGIQITGISPALSGVSLTLPTSIARALGMHRTHEREYGHGRAFVLGALTFFLPCGFTQLVQMSAVTSGGFLQGALLMGAFAVGTAPGLLGIGVVASLLRGMGGRIFFKVAGVAVIALAIFNLRGGINLTGWSLPAWPQSQSAITTTTITDGVQIVRMEQYGYGYRPSSFIIKRGIPVQWIINSTESRSCASSIRVPSLGIARNLNSGENIIEFTPQTTGLIRFTCSMGMYSGSFTVTD
jgi:sulfite exporter TauE/SafE/copper chaperone CopZ